MPSREQIIARARTYLGVPFRHQGRSRQGCDCAGLIICVLRELGCEPKDIKGYSTVPDGHSLKKHVDSQAMRIELGDLKPGDVVLIRFRKDPQHLALVTDYGDGLGLIHSYSSVGRVVEHRLDEKWRRRIVAAYRLR